MYAVQSICGDRPVRGFLQYTLLDSSASPTFRGHRVRVRPQVFDLTYSNLAALGQKIEVVHGEYERLIERFRFPEDRGIVVFVAPPWGTALDEVQGLDLNRTTPPINEVIEQVVRRFSHHKMLFTIQVYEKVSASSLNGIRTRLDWTELRIYDINERGRNHGVFLGSEGWAPTR
jgi:hypothetical protein